MQSAWAAGPTEYQVKAAFLFNFTKFVDWPPERFSSPDAPIIIAVLGRSPCGEELENLVRDRQVGGRRIILRSLVLPHEASADAMDYHILFVPVGAEAQFAPVAAAVVRNRVLSVGESERFAALGGMVNFVVVDDRIRFEINRAAVTAAGLKLSAQLQKLAVPARASASGAPP